MLRLVALGDEAPGLDLPAKDAPMPAPARLAAESEKYGIGQAADGATAGCAG